MKIVAVVAYSPKVKTVTVALGPKPGVTGRHHQATFRETINCRPVEIAVTIELDGDGNLCTVAVRGAPIKCTEVDTCAGN